MTVDLLDDWMSAPFSEPVTATLGVLAALKDSTGAPTPEAVSTARHAGVSDQALSDARHVIGRNRHDGAELDGADHQVVDAAVDACRPV